MSTITQNSALAATLLFVSASVVHAPVQAGPIHDAAKAGDAEQVERLIAAGVDVDEKDIADKTALLWAADAGHMGVVQVLVAKGANVDARDFANWTPVMFAVLGQHETILEFLISKGADVDLADSDGITALDDATRRRYAGVLEILKRADAKCGTNRHYSRDCKQAGGSE
jgi:ankyrin repeat protein